MDYDKVMNELQKIARERVVIKAAIISPSLKEAMLAKLEQRSRDLEATLEPGTPAAGGKAKGT